MISFYDKHGKQLEPVDFIEITWDRKYFECGTFTIYIKASDWNYDIKYVKNTGSNETGIVQKIDYDKDSGSSAGNFITASGFFLEKLLDWGTNYLPRGLTGATTSAQVADLIKSHFGNCFNTLTTSGGYKQLASISLDESSDLPSSMDCTVSMGTPVGKFLYDFLEDSGRSFYCEPVFNTTVDEGKPFVGVNVHTYKGRDLRDSIYFAEGFDDVSKIEYTLDESAEYPLYGVVQEVENPTGFSNIETVNTADGLKYYIVERYCADSNKPSNVGACYPVRVIAGNVSDIQMVSANEALIRAQMITQAKLDMLNHYKIETINADIIQNFFMYQRDYDLGDICTVVLDDIQVAYVARIVEAREVHRNNTVEVSITLGTPAKTQYRKIRA